MNKERPGQETSEAPRTPVRVPPVALLGTYVIGEALAAAPESEVYRATDFDQIPAEREAVVEFFSPLGDRESHRRFDLFRAQLVGLEIPGVSTALSAGVVGGRPYVIRRRIQGETLAVHRSGRGGLSAEDAVRLILPIADALVFAHSRGLIHGEITPAHLRVDPGEMVFLEGFGSSGLRGGGAAEGGARELPTVSGDLAGLATVLQGLYRGRRQVAVRAGPAAALAATTNVRKRLGNSSDLDAIVRRAGAVETADKLAQQPLRRDGIVEVGYGSMAEFAADLRAWLLNRPLQARPPTSRELFREWAVAHPLLILSGVLGVLALLSIPVGTYVWYQRANRVDKVAGAAPARPDLNYSGRMQQAHAALEAEAWERLDALMGVPDVPAKTGPEFGMLKAWLEVQSRQRLGSLGSAIHGLKARGDGSRLFAWTGAGVFMFDTGAAVGRPAVPIGVPGGNAPLAVAQVPDERVVLVGTLAGVFSVPVPGVGPSVPLTQLHLNPSLELKVSPDGHWAASFSGAHGTAGSNGDGRGWDLDLVPLTAGGPGRSVRLPLSPVISWTWIEPEPGSTRIAVALGVGSAGIWDVLRTNYVSTVARAGETWAAAGWDRSGRWLACLDASGTLQLVNFATGEEMFRREGHRTAKPLLALADDGTRVACVAANGDVLIYRIPDGSKVGLLPHRQEELSALAFLSDGTLATGTAAGTVWRWQPETATRQPGVVFTNQLPYVSTHPCFSPDGEWLALPDEWRDETDRFVVQKLKQPGDPESLPGQPAGYLDPQTLLVWDRNSSRWEAWGMSPLRHLGGGRLTEGEAWDRCVLSGDTQRLLVRGPGDRWEMFQTESGQRVGGLNERSEAAALSADGRTVAVALSEAIGVWSPLTGSVKRHPGFRATAVAISADGRWAAFGNDRGVVRLWSVLDLDRSEDLVVDAVGVTALAFSADTQSLFAATQGSKLHALELQTRQELFRHRLTHSAGWLVMAPGDAGLLIGHPAPQDEEQGSSWWWPNVRASGAAPVNRLRPKTTLNLPGWFDRSPQRP